MSQPSDHLMQVLAEIDPERNGVDVFEDLGCFLKRFVQLSIADADVVQAVT